LESCCLCPRECKVDRSIDQKDIAERERGRSCPVTAPTSAKKILWWFQRIGDHILYPLQPSLPFLPELRYQATWGGRPGGHAGRISQKSCSALQKIGCHNINFVVPFARGCPDPRGLAFGHLGGVEDSLVYNSGGYDSVETLRLLDGVFAIYMPDIKFNGWEDRREALAGPRITRKGSRVPSEKCPAKVGDLLVNQRGIARTGAIGKASGFAGRSGGTGKRWSFWPGNFFSYLRQHHGPIPSLRIGAMNIPPCIEESLRLNMMKLSRSSGKRGSIAWTRDLG